MLEQLLHNPFITGGLAVTAFGAILALCRNVPQQLWLRLQSQFVVTVDVLGTDPVFEWVRVWLSRHAYTKRSRLLTVSVSSGADHRPPDSLGQQAAAPIIFTPAPGWHFLRYRGRLVWILRVREGIESAYTIWRERFTICVLGRDPQVARTLIEDARSAFMSQGDGRMAIFRSLWDRWVEADRVVPRPLDSVILPDEGALTRLAANLQRFFDDEAWYRVRGVPYRRGYLFEGQPGSGKSSAIAALAGHLHCNIYLLSLAGRGMSDQALNQLLVQVPPNGIIVLEDADAAFADRNKSADLDDGVTFSGLLNALDGIGAKEGRVLIMTTNHVDRLDPALIRAGRIDVRVTFGPATRSQARRLYLRFHPTAAPHAAAEFAAHYGHGESMADVQAQLIAECGGQWDTPVPRAETAA